MRKEIVLLALAPIGCTAPSDSISVKCGIDPDYTQEAAEFIVRCSEAANPKSDEEGEDLVAQCEKTAANLWCAPVYKYSYKSCAAVVGSEREACVAAGWEPGAKP